MPLSIPCQNTFLSSRNDAFPAPIVAGSEASLRRRLSPPRIASVPNTTERRVDVWVDRSKPISKAAPDEKVIRDGRCSLQYEVLAIKKISRVDRIRNHRREALEGGKRRGRPLPTVAYEILDAPCAGPGRERADRDRVNGPEAEIAVMSGRGLVAPRMEPFSPLRRTEGRSMVFGLGGNPHAGPSRVSGSFGMRDIYGTMRRERISLKQTSPHPALA